MISSPATYRPVPIPGQKSYGLDRVIEYLAPGYGLKRKENRTRLAMVNQYRGAEISRLRADWVLGQSETTPSTYELSTLRARSRDLNRNDPVASGATDTMGINIIGQGLRPQSRLRHEVVGISRERAVDLQKKAELIWREWCVNADSANRLDFDEIQFLAVRKIVEDGEVLALPVIVNDDWRNLKRAIELVEADRLTPPLSSKITPKNTTGVETGNRGEPKYYHIRKAGSSTDFVKIAARDGNGRPKVLHIFRSNRAGQLRGVPFFAPVLTYFKDLADYLEAEVVAARVAACLAVFVTANDPANMGYGAATSTETDTGHRIQELQPGMIDYLKIGEAINVVDPKRPGESFAPFVESILRLIGTSLNLPYELLVKDFSKTNYSSARAALLEGRRMFLNWRSWIARKFCQPIWDLVLEEAYLRGLFDAPEFYKYRHEYARAHWIGGGWGWVDPVKEVEASRKAIDYGLSTLAEETAGQGRDWEEVLEQKAEEDKRADELKVRILNAAKGGADNAASETKEE